MLYWFCNSVAPKRIICQLFLLLNSYHCQKAKLYIKENKTTQQQQYQYYKFIICQNKSEELTSYHNQLSSFPHTKYPHLCFRLQRTLHIRFICIDLSKSYLIQFMPNSILTITNNCLVEQCQHFFHSNSHFRALLSHCMDLLHCSQILLRLLLLKSLECSGRIHR